MPQEWNSLESSLCIYIGSNNAKTNSLIIEKCWCLLFAWKGKIPLFFSPGHCYMTSSNDDVMFLKAYCVI